MAIGSRMRPLSRLRMAPASAGRAADGSVLLLLALPRLWLTLGISTVGVLSPRPRAYLRILLRTAF